MKDHNMNNSTQMFERAARVIPGGVNSPVRAFKSVGLTPAFIKKAKGSRIYDIDGNEYIDYVCSWGPMILGHADDRVVEAVKLALENGSSYGAPTVGEVELAELICDALPSVEMVRLVSSGTEAAMSAIRLARGFRGRDMIVKFEGCYHGHSDSLLVKAGSGALTFGVPDSPGVPADFARNTLTAQYNDCQGIADIFKTCGDKIAAVIVEPVAGNMGVVLPDREFLKTLRAVTAKYGSLLIFDEVITGFRVSFGGAQQYYDIKPDITVLGKIIGGGLPIGAYGGRRDILQKISPSGPVYQAGTLSGNPAAVAAGIETIRILKDNPGIYENIDKKAAVLESAFRKASSKSGTPSAVNRVGSMLSAFFAPESVTDFRSAMKSDTGRFKKYFKEMFESGIYVAPSQFEAMFVSDAHTDEDMELTVKVIEETFEKIKV